MRLLGAIFIGVGGVAALLWLGFWQLHRLDWKEGILAEIEARISAAPVDLPAAPDPQADNYLPVQVSGRLDGAALRFVYSATAEDFIAALQMPDRRVLVDLGLGPGGGAPALPEGAVTIIGNLSFAAPRRPSALAPDVNAWTARDIGAMAEALGTEPVLVVARQITPPMAAIEPLPVGTEGIPNNHLQYAITWFSIAALWLAMSIYLVVRTRRETGTARQQRESGTAPSRRDKE